MDMKKLFHVLVVGGAVIGTSGCDKPKGSEAPAPQTPTSAQKPAPTTTATPPKPDSDTNGTPPAPPPPQEKGGGANGW